MDIKRQHLTIWTLKQVTLYKAETVMNPEPFCRLPPTP